MVFYLCLLKKSLYRSFYITLKSICWYCVQVASQDPEKREPVFRSTTEILRDSLSETPVNISGHGEVRYKLIIDPSEDNSLIRYLFKFGTLEEGNAHVHMCSDLGDSHVDKVQKLSYESLDTSNVYYSLQCVYYHSFLSVVH